MESMLRNLLSNAIKYADGGTVLIGCRQREDALRFEIWDSGIGISPDQQKLIFEEFYQVGNVARDREKGLGLGLSIVQRTARLLGHKIDVRSEAGRGSVFSIEVPLVNRTTTNIVAVADPDHFEGAGKLAVIIDDEPAVLGGLELLLDSLGCELVSNGFYGDIDTEIDSIVKACSHTPDFIIIDYRLPHGHTGVDVIRRLRASFGTDVPAVLLTGEILQDSLLVASDYGLQTLHKPLNTDQLIAALNKLILSSTDMVSAPVSNEAPPASPAIQTRIVGGAR
jgi:two-component system, sensor histidine kinase